MTRRPRSSVAAFAALLALSGCGALGFGEERPGDVEALEFPGVETALSYEADVVGEPSDRVEEMMESSLAIFRREGDGAQSLAFLRRRAEGDVALARRILRSYGYYSGDAVAEVELVEAAPAAAASPASPGVAGRDASAGPAPGPDVDAEPEGEAPARAVARMRLIPGPAYVLTEHSFVLPEGLDGPPPIVPPARELGSPVGETARAEGILAAEAELRRRLRRTGRPWTETPRRRAVADPETATLTVETVVEPGPYARWGGPDIEGLKQVERDHVASYVPWTEGEPVDVDALGAYQRDLTQTDLFSTVVVTLPEDPPAAGPDGALETPVRVIVEEGPRRSVNAGLRLDTENGPLVRGGFLHRNLFGAGERLTVDAYLGVTEQRLNAGLAKPQFLRDGQELRFAAEARHEETDAFDETAFTLAGGLSRELTPEWTVGAGGLLEIAEINDRGDDQTVELIGLPTFVTYDDTDDPLNRTDGLRGELRLTPFEGVSDGDTAPFFVADANLAAYRTVYEPQDVVLAARTRYATIFADELADVPAPRRLYVGGGGSVRGYQTQMVGPLDARNDPVGGRSAFEVGAEVRSRIQGDIGGVAFLDAGAVSRDVVIDFGAGLRYAAGVGFRYYSPVGPIRLDVAFPLNPRDVDNTFEAYFSIGQAF
ncbi:MAG: BamA/TamA family outer membrane protein [Paracoccaceae bacterium]